MNAGNGPSNLRPSGSLRFFPLERETIYFFVVVSSLLNCSYFGVEHGNRFQNWEFEVRLVDVYFFFNFYKYVYTRARCARLVALHEMRARKGGRGVDINGAAISFFYKRKTHTHIHTHTILSSAPQPHNPTK